MKKLSVITLGTIVLFLGFFAGISVAVEVTVFGPKQYVRTKGKPDVFTESFAAVVGTGTLTVTNAGEDNKHNVSSARILLNGKLLFGPRDFKVKKEHKEKIEHEKEKDRKEKNEYIKEKKDKEKYKKPKNQHLEVSVDLAELNTLSVELSGKPGSYLIIEIIEDVASPTINLSATPTNILAGESTNLLWSSTTADSCMIEPGIGPVDVNGSIEVSPTMSTTYTITATGLGGTASSTVTVTVLYPPTVIISSSPETIILGESSTLSWSSNHADAVSINNGIGPVRVNGSVAVTPTVTTTYTITANGPGGTATSTVSVTVLYLPTVTISSSPETIILGETVTLFWTSANADVIMIEPGMGSVPSSGSVSVSPTETTTYTITASGPGGVATSEFEVTVLNPPTVEMTATPGSIIIGESSTLAWTSMYADTVLIEPGVGSFPAGGSVTVSPVATTTYTIAATGPGGTSTVAVTIAVSIPKPTVSFYAAPETIQAGEVSTLSWNSTFADSCTIEPNIGVVATNGTIDVTPSETTTYTITATGPGGSASASKVVNIISPDVSKVKIIEPLDMELIDADTVRVAGLVRMPGASVMVNGILSSVTGGAFIAENVSLQPGTNRIVASAYIPETSEPIFHDEIRVIRLFTYTPQPEGSFGKQYEDLVPPDALVSKYDPKRFALVTGTVEIEDGSSLSGVAVTVLDHPEYGTAFTGADGRYSLPMEGGLTITLKFEKDGLLPSQRKVYVPSNDVAVSVDVRLIHQDVLASTVFLDGSPNTIIAHRGEEVIDSFGRRAATITISGDNRAFAVDKKGNTVKELSMITTRATTYTSPEAMPAELPPTSAYTYCVELTVDEADDVRFDKPVIVWVDNFLGFEVGMAVPSAYYDKNRGVWVPSENGVVIKLLDTDSDGVVDALDANGDELPDDLDLDGFFSDEIAGLNNPENYPAGATFWRMPVTHFSPWDFNMPLIRPTDATNPNPPTSPVSDQANLEKSDSSETNGSINDTDCINSYVKRRSRIFHEDIPIPGTDIALHYTSSRVDGYLAKITVPASGGTVPSSLKRIEVKVEIAGRTLRQALDPLPNQKAEFIWDGLDYLGRFVKGAAAAHISVGFVYDYFYAVPTATNRSFGLPGIASTVIPAQAELILWSYSKLPITKGRGTIAEGWTLSPHHELYLADPTPLHKGDGTINTNINIIIDTIAGYGTAGFSGDGGPATEAQLAAPYDVTVDAEGNLYIADTGNRAVRKVDTEGNISTVAGLGGLPLWMCNLKNNYPATSVALGARSIAVDNAGNLYIADSGHHTVRKVDANGIISTVAGSFTGIGADACTYGGGFGGDGGPAIEAALNSPSAIALDANGNLYIADLNNFRIRKVDPSGIITTVAGNGAWGYGGDGGPATEAQFTWLNGIAIDSGGNLYIADTQNYRIRKVDTGGIITTIAGTGEIGHTGDGGPATQAKIGSPWGLDIDSDDNLYFIDYAFRCVRKIFPDGTITTIAGTPGSYGFSGDGEPATQALLANPLGLGVDSAGNVYIADTSNHRVRKVAPVKAFQTLTDAGEIPFAEDNGIGHITSGSGRHKRTIDLATGSTLREFEYDGGNRVTGIVDPFGNRITIERNGYGTPTAIVSPEGVSTTLLIDGNNHLKGIIYPDASSYSFEYLSNGLMTAEIEPAGNRFDHEFDEIGRLTNVYDQEGGHWYYTRTEHENGDILSSVLTGEGNLTTFLDRTAVTGEYTSAITGPSGEQTLIAKSADGLKMTQSLSCGMNRTIEYGVDQEYKFKYIKKLIEKSASGLSRITNKSKTYQDTNDDGVPELVTETLSVNSKTTTFVNDALQGIKTFTSPEGRTARASYDPATLLTQSMSIPGLFGTTYGYDTRGRLTAVNTNTRSTVFTYNAQGFLETVTAPEKQTTTYTHDPVGRITSILRPDGSTIGFTYDGNGNMTVLTNPFTVEHRFGFNKVNLNSSYETPISGSYSYIYDKDRRLIRTNFPSGKQIFNIYDKTRLSQIQTPEGNIDLTYLCGDTVGTINKDAESISFSYDGKLITSENLSGTLNQALGFTYNNDFNITGFTYAGSATGYSYDSDGLLTSAGSFTITRNAGNGLPDAVSGGSLNLSRTFNGYGEMSSEEYAVGGLNLTSWDLSRDNDGRITQKTETTAGTTSNFSYFSYTYDPMGRLLTVTKDGVLVEEYDYDANGARIYEMNALRGIAGRNFDYDAEDRLLTAGDVTYQYDYDGFLTSRTDGINVTTYDYSSRGELLSVSLPDGRYIEYVHDPLGRRIAKKVNGTIVEKYLWQGLTRLLAIYDGSGNLLMRFEYTDGRMPVAMTTGGNTYYLTYDQVGSLRIVANSSGNVIKKIDYDSFGNIIADSNPAFEVPFGFAGGLHDRDTGLVRFGFRDYDPDVGRWTAKDPIGFASGDTDLYGYVLNNPINAIDPEGLFVGSLLSKGFGKLLGRTAQEAAIAGKAADSLVAISIEMTGVSKNIPNVLGYTGDALQAIGGAQTISLAGLVATYSSITPAAPVVLAGTGGAGLGFAFNNAYQRWRGQSLGEDIYDWFHPEQKDNSCK